MPITDGLTAAILPAPQTDPALSPSGKDSPEKIKNAATQFEALLIGQILKSVHEEGDGWLGSGEDQTAGAAMGMADDYFGKAIAARGGLGLAKMVERSLQQSASAAAKVQTDAETPKSQVQK